MVAIVYLRNLIGRAGVVLMLAFAVLPVAYAGSYGNCDVLLVEGKAPKAPAPDVVVALCEEDSDAVFFATGYSKRDNHGYWSAYRLDEEQITEMDQLHLPRPNVKFKQNPKLKGGGYVQPRHDSLHVNGFRPWASRAERRDGVGCGCATGLIHHIKHRSSEPRYEPQHLAVL